MASKYKAAAMGITADRTHNLMWRLLNGEIPKTKMPKLVLVLIGGVGWGAVGWGGAGWAGKEKHSTCCCLEHPHSSMSCNYEHRVLLVLSRL